MKKAMDLFGEALYDRYQGIHHPFFMDFYGEVDEHNLDRYFRTPDKLSTIEKRMITMCYGNILDVGCGTANYFPLLNKQGTVIGIDISHKVIEVAHKTWNKNCMVADIFSLKDDQKFDTITMFENNIGVGETLEWTKKLLVKIKKLLTEQGQLLIHLSGRLKDKEYVEIELTPIYRDKKGVPFKWINFNRAFLPVLCQQQGLYCKTLRANNRCSLLQITKK